MNRYALSVLTALSMVLAPIALADSHKDERHHVSVDKNNVILNGYDAVAYFTQDKAVKGSDKYTAEYNDATYRFATAEHRDMFVENPEKYAPQYGGWCAYGLALGKKFDVDGKAFEVIDDKLYVNLDKSIQKKWAEDKKGYIEAADEQWPAIVDTPADEL